MNDIMIDLETLSTRPDAHILSIGAVYFNIETGDIGDPFQAFLDFVDRHDNGHISLETVKWWLGRDKAAQEALLNQQFEHPAAALGGLMGFIKPDANIWANGSSFDLPILRSAFQREGLRTPWSYWQERDCRTICDLAQRITGDNVKHLANFSGIKHDTLADAIHQANYVSAAFQLLMPEINP